MFKMPAIAVCDWCDAEHKWHVLSNNGGHLYFKSDSLPPNWIRDAYTRNNGNLMTFINDIFCSEKCKQAYKINEKLEQLLK